MKNNIIFVALAFILTLFVACDPNSVLGDDSNTSDSEETDTLQTVQPSDFLWDGSDLTEIALNGSSISATTLNVTVSGTNATITKAGNYSISGSLSNGQIIVNVDSGIVKIKLNGATLVNTSSSPFYVKKASKAILFLADSTSNSITDATTYSNSDEPNAALFSNCYLGFAGAGSLTVKGNYNDGISSDDQVIINSGKITVTAKDDAIRGKDYLMINSGTIIASATTGHALKSDNADDLGRGYVEVNGGTLTLTSTKADGIHGVKRVIINSGDLSISAASQGLKSDSLVLISGGNTVISSTNEGVESPIISITGGVVSISATDDCLNSTNGNGGENNDNSLISISGGTTYLTASTGDAIDSNGNIVMTGGTVVAHGPSSQPNVGLDYNGTFKISGGLLAVSGIYQTSMTQAPSTTSTQYSLKITSTSSSTNGGPGNTGSTTTGSTLSSTTLFHIQDAEGNDLLTFQPDKSYSSIVFSSPDLKKGSTYYIYTGGSSTGTSKKGLYTGGTYSGGTLKTSFSVSSVVTTVSL